MVRELLSLEKRSQSIKEGSIQREVLHFMQAMVRVGGGGGT